MVHGDRGVENSTVAFMQPFLRRNGLSDQNSFQYGRSDLTSSTGGKI